MRIISDEEFKEVFVAENIMGRLINKNVDREWLSGIPHRTFLDMYIIYQVDISVFFNQPDYVQTAIIDNDVANMMSMREDDLYLAALTNGNRDAYVANIKEFIGLGDEVYDPLEDDLLIITNRNNRFGAFSICCSQVLLSVAERIGDDFIILPGSIHDMCAAKIFPDMDFEYIKRTAADVSHMIQSDEDFLTENIYIYRVKENAIDSVSGGWRWHL